METTFPRNAVTIDYGKVTAASDQTAVGKYMFFVAWCDEDGCVFDLHNTIDYSKAIMLAEEAKRDFAAFEVIDRTIPDGGAA